jgi:hypothetical protein
MTLSSTPAERNDPSAGVRDDVGALEKQAPPTDNSSDDVKSEDVDADGQQEGQDGLQTQPSNVDSIWVAEHMGLGREIAFVVLVCMAQFATRMSFSLPRTTLSDRTVTDKVF